MATTASSSASTTTTTWSNSTDDPKNWFDLEKVFGVNSMKLIFSFVNGNSSKIYIVELGLTNGSLQMSSPALIGQVIYFFTFIISFCESIFVVSAS